MLVCYCHLKKLYFLLNSINIPLCYLICNSADWTSQLAEFKNYKTCNLLNHANSMECNFNGFCLKNWTQWKLVVHSNQHSECTHGRSTATESQIHTSLFSWDKKVWKGQRKVSAMLMSTLVKINVANSNNLSAIIIWQK